MQGLVGIVTGGGSGIGRATCVRLARQGVRVAVLDVALDRGQNTASALTQDGASALACSVDISDASQVRLAVDRVLSEFGRIDILVNCAGVYTVGTVDSISERDWDSVLAVNLKGPFLMCQAVVPAMRRQGGGAIVSVSSISGRTTSMLAGPNYVASKAGIIGLTMCLANQLAADRIRVNCVAPSTVDTPMNASLSPDQVTRLEERVPLRRLATADEVAAAIVFLASPEASYITGETLNVNGGAFMV